jgi:hypothetical protein
LSLYLLDPGVQGRHVFQIQPRRHGGNGPDFFPGGVDEEEVELGAGNSKGKAGKAPARADVEDAGPCGSFAKEGC